MSATAFYIPAPLILAALGGEHAGPLVEGEIAGDDNRAALVALAEYFEQQLGAEYWSLRGDYW